MVEFVSICIRKFFVIKKENEVGYIVVQKGAEEIKEELPELGDENYANELAQIIQNHTDNGYDLIELWCDSMSLEEEDIVQILKQLADSNTLQVLSLRGNNLDDTIAKEVALFLSKNKTLLKLDLATNQIQPKGFQAIANNIKTNAEIALTVLNIDDNNMKDAGAIAMAEMLSTNTTIKAVEMASNGISLDGITAISKALENNTTLTILDLSDNEINDGMVVMLSDAIKSNPNSQIKDLSLAANEITNPLPLIYIPRLEELDLSRNNINVDIEGFKIANALKEVPNSQLKNINIIENTYTHTRAVDVLAGQGITLQLSKEQNSSPTSPARTFLSPSPQRRANEDQSERKPKPRSNSF